MPVKTLRAAGLLPGAGVGSAVIPTGREGCAGLAALAPAKIPRRSNPRNFQTAAVHAGVRRVQTIKPDP